jgi:hypothetical protein
MTAAAQEVAAAPAHDLIERATNWPKRAESLKVEDAAALSLAGEELLAVKGLMAEVDATFDPIIRKQYEAHKEAVAQKKRVREPLERAESILKGAIARFAEAQERLRIEAQRKAEEEARRRAEEELEREIEQAEAEGATVAEVEAIIDRGPIVAPRVFTPPAAKAPAGIVTRETWAAEVTDLVAFIKFVAANPQYAAMLAPNTTAINQMARAMKSTMKFPGLRVYASTNVATRRV